METVDNQGKKGPALFGASDYLMKRRKILRYFYSRVVLLFGLESLQNFVCRLLSGVLPLHAQLRQ